MIHKEGFWLYWYISLEVKRGDRLIKDGGLQGNKTCGCDKRVNLIGITDIIIDKYILIPYDDEIHNSKNCTTVD